MTQLSNHGFRPVKDSEKEKTQDDEAERDPLSGRERAVEGIDAHQFDAETADSVEDEKQRHDGSEEVYRSRSYSCSEEPGNILS